MRHVDVYRLGAFDQPPYPLNRRIDDERQFPVHVQLTGEAYWNGYTWTTAPHEDGECRAHDPSPTAEWQSSVKSDGEAV